MKKNFTKYRRSIVIMAKDKTYKDYLRALKSATESTKATRLTKAYNKALGSFPLVKNKTETKNLLGLKDTTADYLKRRSVLSGASNALAKAGKRTVIGRLADTILKVGSGAGAGYAFAKKDEIEKKKDVKKAKDGMMITKGGDYIKDLL